MGSELALTPGEVSVYYSARVPCLKQTSRREWRGPCPLHDGDDDNFAVNSETGKWFCHSRCGAGGDVYDLERRLSGCEFFEARETVDVIVGREGENAPGATRYHEAAPQPTQRPSAAAHPIRELQFLYRDAHSVTRFRVMRKEFVIDGKPDKSFSQARLEDARWIANMDGVELVPYRLPEMLKMRESPVYVVEGEKCVHAVADLGLAATCNPMGAGKAGMYLKWEAYFRARNCVVIPDHDEPGLKHAADVAEALLSIGAASVRVVELPGRGAIGSKFDVADWKMAGGTCGQLEALTANADALDAAGIIALRERWGLIENGTPLAPLQRGEKESFEQEAGELPKFPEIAWRGVFNSYRRAMDGTTEASDVVHFASLWTACAVALKRNVWFHLGTSLYPNAYICIYGATADKKTTGMRGILANSLVQPHVHLFKSAGSTEGLLEKLNASGKEENVALFFLEEFASLLARSNWSNSTLLEFFTEAYDCPPVYELPYRKQNSLTVNRPTISVLAGSTPEWFWKNAKEENFYCGALNRVLFLTGGKKQPIPRPCKPDASAIAEVQRAVAALADIASGEAHLSSSAERAWDRFYEDAERGEKKGLYGVATKRLPAYALKLAMVYAALENTLPEITLDQLKAAIAVALYAEACARELIECRNASAGRALAEKEERFVAWVRKNQGKKKRDMQMTMSKICANAEEFNRILGNVARAGHIDIRDGNVYLAG